MEAILPGFEAEREPSKGAGEERASWSRKGKTLQSGKLGWRGRQSPEPSRWEGEVLTSTGKQSWRTGLSFQEMRQTGSGQSTKE